MTRISRISLRSFTTAIFFILVVTICTVVLNTSSAHGLSGSDFQAGRIMDDSVFYDKNSMSASQIQQFLNAKVPTCDTNGLRMYNSTQTRAQWAIANNRPRPPYICLKDFTQNVPAIIASGSDLCSGSTTAGNKTAAQIIHSVSQACGINPKVMLVLLQKEQSFITDDWPWPVQYTKATGYGCPDSPLPSSVDGNNNGCYDEFEGFFNQIYKAAEGFKRYQANPNNYNYRAGRNNTILWHPNSSCGSSNVFIENQATAGLYIYTPYRPNQAALNNLYGTGNSCSSYGNRNFWRMYNDWFGRTIDSPLFRIGNTDAVYILGSNNNYYHVPNKKVLDAYGFGSSVSFIKSVSSNYVSGRTLTGKLPPIARFESSEVYLMSKGKSHHVTSRALLEDYGYTIGQEAHLRSDAKAYYLDGEDVQNVSRSIDGPKVWLIENGKKQHFSNSAAFNTGTPSYSSRSFVTLSDTTLSFIPEGPPILVPNIIINRIDTNTFAFWNGTQLQNLTPLGVKESKLPVAYKGSSAAINQMSLIQPQLDTLARSGSGDLFILSDGKKLRILNPDIAHTGIASNRFIAAPDGMLNAIVEQNFSRVFRIQGKNQAYIIENGKAYPLHSRIALEERGFALSDIITLPTSTASLFPISQKKVLHLGTLFRINGTSKVMMVNTPGTSVHIPSRAFLNDFGLSLDDVINLTRTEAMRYPEESKLTNIIRDSSNNVWLINNNSKRLVSVLMQSTANYNLTVSSLSRLDTNIVAFYQTQADLTQIVRAPSSPKVYKIENGKKRWVTSSSALSSIGFSSANITNVSSNFLNQFNNGSNISL